MTHTVNSSNCFVNLVNDLNKVESIRYDVNKFAANNKNVEPKIGQAYAANLNGAW